MDFKDKVAVVTGSARGIGLTIAERFAKLGAKVVICDVDEAAIKEATGQFSTPVLGLKTDVTSSGDIAAMVEATQKEFGRIDIVVNNAGITRDKLLLRMDEKDWELVLDINLKGAFLIIKATSRVMMKQRSGRIINISSVVGLTGNAGQANYSASKAGLIGLTKSAAKELAGRNITVNAVAPGFIETEMTRNLPEAAREDFLKKVLINRPGTPDDIASAVAFLASDEAAYITGQVLTVDGGLTV
jgi:3-oxoacyl-[acyl-carrier protein] reductase